MKTPVVFLTIVLEIAFIIYCIHMTYLLDVQDPMPRELMLPNFLIGGAILAIGYLVALWFRRELITRGR